MAQCGLLINPLSTECFLGMLHKKSGCFSPVFHLLKVTSIGRCLLFIYSIYLVGTMQNAIILNHSFFLCCF